jgi:hypothetical protein
MHSFISYKIIRLFVSATISHLTMADTALKNVAEDERTAFQVLCSFR